MSAPPPPPSAATPSVDAQQPPMPAEPRPQPTPGLFDNIHNEVRQTLCFPNMFFDGAKFSFSRVIGQALQVSHSVALGSQTQPAVYNFSPTYLGSHRPGAGEAYPLVMGNIDSTGNLIARVIHEFTPRCRGQIHGQTQGKGWAGAQAEIEYHGSDYGTSLKLVNTNPMKESGIIVTNYLQKVTEKLQLGGELTYQYGPTGEHAGLTFGGRYVNKAKYYSVNFTGSPLGMLQINYVQGMAKDAAVAVADLDIDLRQAEAVATIGIQYNFRQAVFRGQINSMGQIASMVEHSLGPTLSLVLGGLIDHYQGQSRWGVGLNFQM